VAQRSSGQGAFDGFDDFERAFDSLFDDLLISRWRGPAPAGHGDAQVTDLGDRYEVRMARLHAEPDQLEIEATERRLIVRVGVDPGRHQRVVNFQHHIDAEAVTARLQDAELWIILPKRRPRKIRVA
jgi:HSP20 family molecular chaperone IbpA